MVIDPAQIFSRHDVAAARRLNRFLSLLPRYHPHRRANAMAINAAIKLSQLLPSRRHLAKDMRIETERIGSGQSAVSLRRLVPLHPAKGVYLHFHGGAWVLGNARLDDGFNAEVMRDCRMEVVAVDFHRAVDDRLDQAVAQAKAAVEWTFERAARAKLPVIIGGESSGAQLASEAFLSVQPATAGSGFTGFLSYCGAFDMEGSASLRSAPHDSLLIDAPSAFANLQRLGASAYSPLAHHLHGLPPALFIAGDLDPIRDDSRSFHAAWQKANLHADLLMVPEGPHGFHRLPTKLAAATRKLARQWMRDRLAAALGE